MNVTHIIQPDDVGDDYLTSAEAAELCGVKRNTIQAWVHRGHLEPYAVAGGYPFRHLYKREDVIACNLRRTGAMGKRSTPDQQDFLKRFEGMSPDEVVASLEAHLEQSLRDWRPEVGGR